MNRQFSNKLDKVKQRLNPQESTRLWVKTTISQLRSLEEYLSSVLQNPTPEDPLAKLRGVGKRRAGSLGLHRGDSNRALAQAERESTFVQSLVLELNSEVQRTVENCFQRLGLTADIVELVALFVDESHQAGNVAKSRASTRRAARASNRLLAHQIEVIERKLSNARAVITDAMIDLEGTGLTIESMSAKFWNLDLLFRSVATGLEDGRRLATACMNDLDGAVTRIRAGRRRSCSVTVGLTTINRESIAKSARESSVVLSNKLGAFARASMLLSFGEVEQARTLVSPHLGRHAGEACN